MDIIVDIMVDRERGRVRKGGVGKRQRLWIFPLGSGGSLLQAVEGFCSAVRMSKGIKPPRTPLAAQKERVNEQGQTLPTKEGMLYLLFTNLQGPCAIQN